MNSAMTVEEIKAKIKANYVEMYKLYYSGNYVPLLTEAEDSTEEVGKAVQRIPSVLPFLFELK